MKGSYKIAVIIALASLVFLFWLARDQLPWNKQQDVIFQDNSAKQRSVLVKTAVARRADVKVTIEAIGTARANEAVIITSKVPGVISLIHFTEGSMVKAGDILIELESEKINAELTEQITIRDNALRVYKRAQKLHEGQSIPRARLDDLHGELLASEARVKAHQATIKDYYIRAPFDGRIGLRKVSLGALISPGHEITTLDDTNQIKVDFRIPESAFSNISPGQSVIAASAAHKGSQFLGRVKVVDTRVDPRSRSVKVLTLFDNPQNLIRPGMFLTAKFTQAIRPNSVLVPEQAIIMRNNKSFVFSINDGIARKKGVTTGEHASGDIEILSGLLSGEPVIVSGNQKLRDGTRIKIFGSSTPKVKPN